MTPWKVARSSQAGFSVEQNNLPCVSVFLTYALVSCRLVQGLEELGEEGRSGMYTLVGRQSFISEACAFRPVFHVCFVRMFYSKVFYSTI